MAISKQHSITDASKKWTRFTISLPSKTLDGITSTAVTPSTPNGVELDCKDKAHSRKMDPDLGCVCVKLRENGGRTRRCTPCPLLDYSRYLGSGAHTNRPLWTKTQETQISLFRWPRYGFAATGLTQNQTLFDVDRRRRSPLILKNPCS